MFDFSLTESGDLDIESKTSFAPFHVRFTAAKYKAQHVSFLCMPKPIIRAKKKGQHITFRYTKPLEEAQYIDIPVQDNAELFQAMNIEFRTELGDVLDETVGSDFYKHIHQVIKSEGDLEKLQAVASVIVKKYFPNATTELSYEIHEDAGNFKYQSIVCRIYDESEKLIGAYIF